MRSKILLADDSPQSQRMGSRILSDLGYAVVAVGNGTAALHQIETQPPPDLLIADSDMPGMNGYELCAALSNHPQWRHIPVILALGVFEPLNPEAELQAHPQGIVRKPFEASTLEKLVSELLELAQNGKHANAEAPEKTATEDETGEISPASPVDEPGEQAMPPQPAPEFGSEMRPGSEAATGDWEAPADAGAAGSEAKEANTGTTEEPLTMEPALETAAAPDIANYSSISKYLPTENNAGGAAETDAGGIAPDMTADAAAIYGKAQEKTNLDAPGKTDDTEDEPAQATATTFEEFMTQATAYIAAHKLDSVLKPPLLLKPASEPEAEEGEAEPAPTATEAELAEMEEAMAMAMAMELPIPRDVAIAAAGTAADTSISTPDDSLNATAAVTAAADISSATPENKPSAATADIYSAAQANTEAAERKLSEQSELLRNILEGYLSPKLAAKIAHEIEMRLSPAPPADDSD